MSQTLNDSEPEDVLHAVDPNEVFPNGPLADPSSESDSGISEDPVVESPVTMVTAVTTATTQPNPTTIYQVVYDISGLSGVKTEPGQENMISIELGECLVQSASKYSSQQCGEVCRKTVIIKKQIKYIHKYYVTIRA